MTEVGLNGLAREIHALAIEKGFWGEHVDDKVLGSYTRNFGEVCMLIVSEIAEAMEEYRDGNLPGRTYYKYSSGLGPMPLPRRELKFSPEKGIMLVYSETLDPETGEALEREATPSEIRDAGYDVKPMGVPSEFADTIIRILDACAAWGIDIEKAVAEKMEYNRTRSYKHGKVC